MLEYMRNSANSWLAKLLLGLVALSFISWGAQRKSISFGGTPSLARVGGTEITEQSFGRAFENEVNALSQRARRRITASEARTYGIDRQVLSRLVGEAAIDSQTQSLGLGVSESALADQLQKDPNFQDINGKFDRSGFELFLKQNGFTERGYLATQRQGELRRQLVTSLLGATVTPAPVLTAIHNWKDESRILESVTLDPVKAVTVTEADATKLKEVYSSNLDQFKAPEYKKLRVLLLSVDELKSQMLVTDDEITKSYTETKEDYATPERRRIQILRFKDKTEAEAAKVALDGGKDFLQLAQERGFSPNTLDQGLIVKKSMRDKKLAEASFAIEKDKVSPVINGDLAYAIVRVPEIEPGKQPTLDDVRDRVRDKLARAKAKEEVQKLRDSVDDLRNAAKADVEIADALKLKVLDVAATDRTNKTPEGKTAIEGPDGNSLVAAGFDTKAGVDHDPVDLVDGGYGWVNVVSTTPVRQKPFEEVQSDVKTFYESSERTRLLRELAGKFVERLNKGEPMETIASELATSVNKTEPAITRTIIPQGLTEGAVKQAFALPAGRAGSVETSDGKSRIVFKVAEIKPAEPMSKAEMDKLASEVGQQIQYDAIDTYLQAVQDKVGVKINDMEFRRVAGSESAQ